MKLLSIYRIISYLLVIIAGILGFAVLFALLLALANPALLLSVFIAVAVVLYTFSSFVFLIKGVDGKQKLRSRMKDFIKVNAYVSIVFAVMNIIQAVSVILTPTILNDAMSQIASMQQSPTPLPAGTVLKVVKGMIWFLLVYGILLSVHIQITFRLMKQHASVFEQDASAS